jgi:hypothetical protein
VTPDIQPEGRADVERAFATCGIYAWGDPLLVAYGPSPDGLFVVTTQRLLFSKFRFLGLDTRFLLYSRLGSIKLTSPSAIEIRATLETGGETLFHVFRTIQPEFVQVEVKRLIESLYWQSWRPRTK